MKKNIEVLSPAGSYESFQAAVNAGADAIYLGGSAFGARAYSNNFTEDELVRAIDYAHIHDRKVYMTANTLLKDVEMNEQLYNYLRPYYENGLDAVIVQDMGVFNFVKENFPELHIHASTQMTTTGAPGAKLLKELGASRIVLSRELNLKEIKDIDDNVDIEIEGFVHGALCYCYSGQCLLSSIIGGRSGNRGRCAQPCRLPYDVVKNDTVINPKNEKYVISPKDMCALPILPQVIEAGVDSLKIEGRMKSSEYTAGVVSIYRKYVDMYLEKGASGYKVDEADMNSLKDLFNRGGFTDGYFGSETGRSMLSLNRPNHQGTRALEVISNNKGCITCRIIEDIYAGDFFEIGSDFTYTNKSDTKKGGTIVLNVPHKYDIRPKDIIYRTKNNALTEDIKSKYINTEIKEMLEGSLELFSGRPAKLSVRILDQKGSVRASASAEDDIVQTAEKQPMDEERVRKQLSKTGGTPYTFSDVRIEMGDDIFVPIQKLNDLRRTAIEKMEKQLCDSYKREIQIKPDFEKNTTSQNTTSQTQNGNELDFTSSELSDKKQENIRINVSVENKELLGTALSYAEVEAIYLEISEYENDTELEKAVMKCKNTGKKVYLTMPHIFRLNTRKSFESRMKEITSMKIDGFVVRNLEEFEFFREYYTSPDSSDSLASPASSASSDNSGPVSIILDYNVYTFNKYAREEYKKLEIEGKLRILYDTAPVELNEKELRNLDISNSELVVYGFLPMMVTAQCINKTVNYCDKKNAVLYLKDRKNKQFAVKNNCRYCYNTIYNTSPLYIIDKTNEIITLDPKSVRIILTNEDQKTAGRVIEDAVMAFNERTKIENSLKDFTRGHFLRGVE